MRGSMGLVSPYPTTALIGLGPRPREWVKAALFHEALDSDSNQMAEREGILRLLVTTRHVLRMRASDLTGPDDNELAMSVITKFFARKRRTQLRAARFAEAESLGFTIQPFKGDAGVLGLGKYVLVRNGVQVAGPFERSAVALAEARKLSGPFPQSASVAE